MGRPRKLNPMTPASAVRTEPRSMVRMNSRRSGNGVKRIMLESSQNVLGRGGRGLRKLAKAWTYFGRGDRLR
jgi:hypothetical protein